MRVFSLKKRHAVEFTNTVFSPRSISTFLTPLLQSTLITAINSVIRLICEVEMVVLLCKFMNIIQITYDVIQISCHTHSFSLRNLLEIIKGIEAKAPEI